MTKYKIKQPITILRDDLILKQLPSKVRTRLGPVEETGFHLSLGRRDLFCRSGLVQYILGSSEASVAFE